MGRTDFCKQWIGSFKIPLFSMLQERKKKKEESQRMKQQKKHPIGRKVVGSTFKNPNGAKCPAVKGPTRCRVNKREGRRAHKCSSTARVNDEKLETGSSPRVGLGRNLPPWVASDWRGRDQGKISCSCICFLWRPEESTANWTLKERKLNCSQCQQW